MQNMNRGPEYAPLVDENGLYLLDGRHSAAHNQPPATEASPRTAPENAEADLKSYEQQARRYTRRAKRLAMLSIGLAVCTAAIGAFTAIADQAILGVATGVLGALAVGVEGIRTHNKDAQKATAYRTGHVEIGDALRRFSNPREAIVAGSAEDIRRKAELTDRLGEINKATESQLS